MGSSWKNQQKSSVEFSLFSVTPDLYMTSTSITTVGGVVVVTQVIPQDENGIQLQAANARQAPPTAPSSPAKVDYMTAAFLRGQPQGLGVVQIFIGVMCILFSLTAAFSHILIDHAPFCLAVPFVVSGSLAVAAGRRTSVRLVWASLVSNVISTVLGLVGVAYLCYLLADRSPSEWFCDAQTLHGFMNPDKQKIRCLGRMWIMNVLVYGPLGLLLVLLVLHVCVAVTVCVFSCKALRRCDRYTPIVVEADDCSPLQSAAASGLDSDVAPLDSDAEETSTNSP